MQSLVKLANVYIGSKKKEGVTANHSVLHGIAKYLTRLLKIFGANDGEQEIGFPVSGIGGSENVTFALRLSLVLYYFSFKCSMQTKREKRTVKRHTLVLCRNIMMEM